MHQLSSLVLYGDGVATSVAHALFMHDPAEEPLLPLLSHLILGINDIIADSDFDLCRFLNARQEHSLPRLRKLSVNWKYIQHFIESDRMNILWEGSDEVLVVADPEYGAHVIIR